MSNIWLTRPAQQAEALKTALIQRGADILHIPMLEIEALAWNEDLKTRILNFDLYDMAFFISTNAAKLGMECINNYWPQYPSHIKNFALGPSTAAVLQDYDQLVTYPTKAMSSEAVLALPELNEEALLNKKVLIFRGLGGRELLAEGLRGKGAAVDYLAMYRRKIPQYSAEHLENSLSSMPPDAVVISSAEALENFASLFAGVFWPDFLKITLFVSSARIQGLAADLGFERIIAMPGANDEAIISSLAHEVKNLESTVG